MFATVTMNALLFFQTVDKKEFREGYKTMQKSHPDKYLKMQQGFNLTADIDTARILPKVQFALSVIKYVYAVNCHSDIQCVRYSRMIAVARECVNNVVLQ